MYARLIHDYVEEHGGVILLLVSPGTASSPEYQLHFGDTSVQNIFTTDWTLDGIQRFAAQRKVSCTVILDGDGFILSSAVRGWSVGALHLLVMRSSSQDDVLSKVRGLIKQLARQVSEYRSNVNSWALVSGLARPAPGREVADPIRIHLPAQAEVSEIKEIYGLDSDRYWFGVVGAITRRKNPRLIMESLAHATRPVGLLLAGAMASDLQNELVDFRHQFDSRLLRVQVSNKGIDGAKFDALIRALDCVVLAHSNEGPSGVLARAVTLGTRVVAAGARTLLNDAQLAPDKVSWCRLDAAELSASLQAASTSTRPAPAASVDWRNFPRSFVG